MSVPVDGARRSRRFDTATETRIEMIRSGIGDMTLMRDESRAPMGGRYGVAIASAIWLFRRLS